MSEHPSWANSFWPPGEPIPGKTYRADGWAYVDFPKMKADLWAELLRAIGEENFAPLALANYGRTARGQLIVSPEGIEQMKQWVETREWEPQT